MELVHCRRFRVARWWLQALPSEAPGPLHRAFPVAASCAPKGNDTATDARPWSFDGVLCESFKVVAWYATPLTKNGLRKFRASIGSSKLNTTSEALALVVAVRLWLPGTQVLARVRSDSLSALRDMVRLSCKSADLNVIALELALDAVLGLHSAVARLISQAFPADYLTICHECGGLSRNVETLQISIGHDLLQTTVGILEAGLRQNLVEDSMYWRQTNTERGSVVRDVPVAHTTFLDTLLE